jgi:Predicted membrane protein involved in D-alanine export
VFLFVFLPVNLILYFVIKNRTYRNTVLIITSLAFYAWGEPVWVVLLVFTSFFDYINGLIAGKYRGRWQSKAALIASISGNLFILGFFKYTDFLIGNINTVFGLNLPYTGFALPIGISFYTFQTISYVVDVYRGDVEAQKSPFKLLLFVSLFHQLVAGPIVRYKDIALQIDTRVITPDIFSQGVNRFVIGLAKKVMFANTAGEIQQVFLGANISNLSVFGAWYGIIMFALQIYFDFSGYSDMAIGLGKMFGFTYKENFDHPYISASATEFWRRWHISLGSFFKDYLYIPLGGNRHHMVRNLIIVWFLTGLWHGASWNFVLWGVYYGLLIILEKLLLQKILERIPKIISHIYSITVILVGWVLFYYTDMGKASAVLGIMFGFSRNAVFDINAKIYFLNNMFITAAAIIACLPITSILSQLIQRKKGYEGITGLQYAGLINDLFRPALNFTLLAASTIMLVGKSYNPFLYFRF